MAKPWAKYEHNFINHPKFLALNSNAICLWIEAKNYCDMHHTDGFIPSNALKSFRWRGQKSLRLLTTSIGQREDGSAWAPLWESHLVGFKMHDYLSYNDCHDKVLARIAANDELKQQDADRKAKARAAKKEKAVSGDLSGECPPRTNGGHITDRPEVVREMSGSITATTTATEEEKKEHTETRARPRGPTGDGVFGGALPREHLKHSWCGRKCVPSFLHLEFVRALGGAMGEADRMLRGDDMGSGWYLEICNRIGDKPNGEDPIRFWRTQFAAQWPGEQPAALGKQSSRLMSAVASIHRTEGL